MQPLPAPGCQVDPNPEGEGSWPQSHGVYVCQLLRQLWKGAQPAVGRGGWAARAAGGPFMPEGQETEHEVEGKPCGQNQPGHRDAGTARPTAEGVCHAWKQQGGSVQDTSASTDEKMRPALLLVDGLIAKGAKDTKRPFAVLEAQRAHKHAKNAPSL